MIKNKIKISEEQEEAIKRMSSDEYSIVFITGKAGTGKSTIINEYIKRRAEEKKTVIVLGSTGIAALNIKGSTVHSFFKLRGDGFDRNFSAPLDEDMFASFDEIIIDEVSMIRADLMNAILNSLQDTKGAKEGITGGKKLILVGDLAQLPPVVRGGCERTDRVMNQYPGIYFYHALLGIGKVIDKVELREIHRQEDLFFKEMLNDFRLGNTPVPIMAKMNERVSGRPNGVITLASTRAKVADINSINLKNLQGKLYTLKGSFKGKYGMDTPSAETIEIKEGARIMFTVNKYEEGESLFFNGEMGTVKKRGIGKKDDNGKLYLVIKKDSGETVRVYPHTWEQMEYVNDEKGIKKEIVGTFKQFPITLGWAITIHKSQGLNFDKIHIDTGNGCFAHGQLYVALSRCRFFEGITLEKPISNKDLIFDRVLQKIVA